MDERQSLVESGRDSKIGIDNLAAELNDIQIGEGAKAKATL